MSTPKWLMEYSSFDSPFFLFRIRAEFWFQFGFFMLGLLVYQASSQAGRSRVHPSSILIAYMINRLSERPPAI